MNSANDVITVEAVDREIANRFRMLRFSAPIERKFNADGAQARCQYLIRQNYIALIIYHAFIFADYCSIPDAMTTDFFVHFAVTTPIVLLVNLGRRPPVWLRESLEAFGMVSLALTNVLVVFASHSPLRDIVLLNIIIVVLFATFVQRIRFWYALVTCLVLLALYSIGLAGLIPLSMDRTLTSIFMFVGTLTFVLVGYYNLEHEQRMGYLLRLRDHIRNHDLELISLKDALTGVGNRRALDEALSRLVKDGVAAPAVSTAILLLDIDHFKAFNDVNGHQEGDVCLKRVAQLVDGAAHDKGQDVYRFGGEEFLVLLQDTTIENAVIAAERIRSAVALATLPRNSQDRGKGPAHVVTISVGAAAGRLNGETTPAALIDAADAALYAAKYNGRNRVWSALHRDPSGLASTTLDGQSRAA